MAFNLTIDIGNTATKMSLWLGDTLVATQRTVIQDAGVLHAFIAGRNVEGVILGAVGDVVTGFEEAAESVASCRYIRLDQTTPVEIVIDYETPSTLGSDRLAAAVGALDYFDSSPMLVADLGTAATFDRVDTDRHYCGGVISPGLRMRIDALHNFTACLPQISSESLDSFGSRTRSWGRSTVESIALGAINGIVAELIYYIDLYGPATKAVLTGGDARRIVPFLPADKAAVVTIDDDLVCRGLNRILRYNEK